MLMVLEPESTLECTLLHGGEMFCPTEDKFYNEGQDNAKLFYSILIRELESYMKSVFGPILIS